MNYRLLEPRDIYITLPFELQIVWTQYLMLRKTYWK